MNKLLTIAIPTYNRKNQLIRLLNSIEKQKAFDKYYIVILNNNSNYDVEKSIKEHFFGEFLDNITIYNRPYNGGGHYNIGSAFLFAKTQYLWIIGDDDEVCDGCLSIIQRDIANNPELPIIKYHIKGQSQYTEDIIIKGINDFKSFYLKKYFIAGDIIFVSNCLYNLPQIADYIPTVLYYTYTSVPHTLPMLRCLADERNFMWSHHEIIKYNEPEGDHWNYVTITTSLSTVLDINIDGKYVVVREFFKIISSHWGIVEFLHECLKIKDKRYRKHVCKKGLMTLFAEKRIGYFFFYILYKMENNIGIQALSLYIYLLGFGDNLKQYLKSSNSIVYRTYIKIKKII
jgi:glycosyltransferase involved in cell wall biosynthesis